MHWSCPVREDRRPDRRSFRSSILWWILIAVIGIYVLGRTHFGNWIAGVGGSAGAARNLGVPVARVKIALFALTAFSAAVLAAIQTMTFSSADILRGRGYELDAITTAVIGGSLLTGGYGSVAGTALGALALGMARQGIVFAEHQCRLVQDRDRHPAAGRRRPQQLDPAPVRRPDLGA